MKRLISAAVLLALIITVCILSNMSIRKSIKKAESEISECRRFYKQSQFDKAAECADAFNKHWLKQAKTVSLYSHHCPLDDITVFSSILPEAARAKNDFEFYSTARKIESALNTIYNEQSLTLESFY